MGQAQVFDIGVDSVQIGAVLDVWDTLDAVDFLNEPVEQFEYQDAASALLENRLQRKAVFDVVVEQLLYIKTMDRHQIPKAIVDLFHQYASFDSLGAGFEGDDIDFHDRSFMSECMAHCFIQLGYGSHSAAYQLDTNWIIKLNCTNLEYSGEDAGFEWARACTEFQHNTFIPKIAALYQKDYAYCMVSERLVENKTRYNKPVYQAPDAGCFLDLAETHHPEMDFAEYLLGMHEHPTFVMMANMHREDLIELSKMYESVSNEFGCNDDLMDFNMMLRGDIPVMNDPFCDANSDYLTVGQTFDWVAGQ